MALGLFGGMGGKNDRERGRGIGQKERERESCTMLHIVKMRREEEGCCWMRKKVKTKKHPLIHDANLWRVKKESGGGGWRGRGGERATDSQ